MSGRSAEAAATRRDEISPCLSIAIAGPLFEYIAVIIAETPNVKDEPRRADYHGVSLAGQATELPPVAALALATC